MIPGLFRWHRGRQRGERRLHTRLVYGDANLPLVEGWRVQQCVDLVSVQQYSNRRQPPTPPTRAIESSIHPNTQVESSRIWIAGSIVHTPVSMYAWDVKINAPAWLCPSAFVPGSPNPFSSCSPDPFSSSNQDENSPLAIELSRAAARRGSAAESHAHAPAWGGGDGGNTILNFKF
jgi:hypothetical protein